MITGVREEMKQAKQNFISMTSHRLINVHWKINTYIIYKMVIAGDIRRQIYVCLGCPPFMADIIILYPVLNTGYVVFM